VEGEIIIILPVIHSLKVNIVIILPGGGVFTLRLDYLKYYYYLPLLQVR
jgi:hypothetical protein